MIYPKSFENLRESFERLPGIGEKSAERFIFSILKMDEEYIKDFSNNLINLKKHINKCQICGHLTEEEKCYICEDKTRDQSIICLVEDARNVFMLEKTGSYHGLYHVLGGLISPIDDVNPEDLNISNLFKRINPNLKEIIIAVNPSIEGQTTSLYIQKLLKDKEIFVSRLSYGIPLGSELDYIDPLMIEKAMDDRKVIK